MKKKILALAIAAIMVVTAIASVSLAYLQDTDYDKNTMTVGNVKIQQIEQQRKEDGSLEPFVNDKKLLPATADAEWTATMTVTVNKDTNKEQTKEYQAFGPEFNPLDKIVTVKNIGSEAAYVRTLIAFENNDDGIGDLIHINTNSDAETPNGEWHWEYLGDIEISGNPYQLLVFTYKKILPANEETLPSLLQIWLDKTADNDDMEALTDGYEILVLSQAVQAAGWQVVGEDYAATAEKALDAAFGDVTGANANEWFSERFEQN